MSTQQKNPLLMLPSRANTLAPTRSQLGPTQRGLYRWIAQRVVARAGPLPLRFVLWNGECVSLSAEPPRAVVFVKNRRTLLKLLLDPWLHFGDAYGSGDVVVEGDLVGAIGALYRAGPEPSAPDRPEPARKRTARAARVNVQHHYDLGNDFYRLWLDARMVYTCAYFSRGDMSLEHAQLAKMDHVCRKLRLRRGERVVEAGCGWGALARHMAARYGVHVTACNLSREQVRYAREQARDEGLADRVTFLEEDFRNLRGRYDAFVSVGMLEHVGREHYDELGRVIQGCLDPRRGRGLLHFIGRNQRAPLNPWIRKRIFPGAYPPTLSEVTSRVLEPWDLSVLDVENLRLHYARTLEHWRERFETTADLVETMFDAAFTRAWRLYLAGSQAAFAAGAMQLFQIVFARSADNGVPWTRAALYRDALEMPGGAA